MSTASRGSLVYKETKRTHFYMDPITAGHAARQKDDGFFVQTFEEEEEEEDTEYLTRDEFNLHKMVVAVSSAGKVRACVWRVRVCARLCWYTRACCARACAVWRRCIVMCNEES